jgi:protein arginine kinase activator
VNKRKCDKCNQPATHHSVEILKGQKIEKHLCDLHAAEEGLTVKAVHTPINELLTHFVKLHSGAPAAVPEKECPNCGLSFSQFRTTSLLGCPQCYDAFDELLTPMLEMAHDGGSHHIGKVPTHAISAKQEQGQLQVLSMRKRLAQAVASEDYELAATLRDQIGRLEEGRS